MAGILFVFCRLTGGAFFKDRVSSSERGPDKSFGRSMYAPLPVPESLKVIDDSFNGKPSLVRYCENRLTWFQIPKNYGAIQNICPGHGEYGRGGPVVNNFPDTACRPDGHSC